MLSSRVQTMSVDAARATFFGYALLNGMVLSYYFLVFSVGTLIMAFLATSVYFGLMAVYGTTTHKDLTGWGPCLMMALVALIVTSLIGMLFGFGFGGSVLYCGIGLVVFMLLTAYDTQKLQQMYSYYSADAEMAEKASIYGALTLYWTSSTSSCMLSVCWATAAAAAELYLALSVKASGFDGEGFHFLCKMCIKPVPKSHTAIRKSKRNHDGLE